MRDVETSELWKVFVALERQLTSEDNTSAMDTLLDALHRVDAGLHYYLGHHDYGHDLLISVEGNLALGPLVESLVRSAPRLSGWKFRPIVDESIFGEHRDAGLYPSDENGDVLFRMARNGDLMWRSRPVDFSFVFPTHDDAQQFAGAIDTPAVVSAYEDAWQVEARVELVPTHAAITELERRLDQLARAHRGRADGWGCFEERFESGDGA